MIGVSASRGFKKALRLAEEWPERTAYLTAKVPYDVAAHVRGEVRGGIPGDEAWASYRKSMTVSEVGGLPEGVGGYVTHADVKSRRVGMIAAHKMVLYVIPKSRMRSRVPESVSILNRFSPWTLFTIPFIPDPRDARMVSRRVRVGEVQKVARDRQDDSREWRPLLARAGVRPEDRLESKRRKIGALGIKTTPDVAFEAMRLEFGLGGEKGRPHWRPALRRLRGMSFGRFARRQVAWRRALTDPRWRGWRRGVARVPVKPVNQMGRYTKFQGMLSIRN